MKTADPGVLSAEEFTWGIGALAALFRRPFDPHLLLTQFPPPYTLDALLLAARGLGLDGQQVAARASPAVSLSLPALALLTPAPGGGGGL